MARTGEILINEGLVGPEDVDQAAAMQAKTRDGQHPEHGQLLGKVLCDMNLVTPTDAYCALEKHNKLVSVKTFLLRKNMASTSRLDRAETMAVQKDMPYISQLLEEGIVSKSQLQQVLFDLFHIPFRSVSDIVFDDNSRDKLSRVVDRIKAARNKVVPLQLAGNTIVVGITGPENLMLLREMDNRFPQYRFTPIFITFSGFAWFFKMLYRESWKAVDASEGPAEIPPKKLPETEQAGTSSPLDFSLVVKDPDQDRTAIFAFYSRYEGIRRNHLGKNNRKQSSIRAVRFFDFIRHHHRDMARRYGCNTIEFSLKQDGTRLMITALPKKE